VISNVTTPLREFDDARMDGPCVIASSQGRAQALQALMQCRKTSPLSEKDRVARASGRR
jgi:hypothetical protein